MPPQVLDLRSADDSRDAIHRAVQALAEGQLVAFPTETVYGLAACALNEAGVARLVSAKRRAEGHPVTLAIKSADEALDYIPSISPLARRLARRCWPGPVTLVVDDNHPDSLTKQLPESVQNVVIPDGTLGLRVPAHQAVLEVLRLMAGPIALSSANRAGASDTVTAEQVVEALGDDVQLVLDDGRSRYGQPSSVVRVCAGQFEVLREGVVSEATLRRLASFMVLLVCTGNTCRSPMAEALWNSRLAKRLGCEIDELEDRGYIAMSAGLAAMPGVGPSAEGVEVMKEQGLDIADHVSQALSEQLVHHADLILTMTAGHRQAIVTQWPEAALRTHLLCGEGSDVSDPIGGPIEAYRSCAKQIVASLDAWVDRLEL